MADKAASSRQNGKRGGRPKGSKNKKTQSTIDKEILRETARAVIAPHLTQLLEAQIAHAIGLKYLVTRDKKTGKFIRVTEAMARRKAKKGDADAPAENEEVIEVWEKDPSVQAFTDLLNRLIDKPAEQPQELKVEVSGRVTLAQKIAAARQRLQSHAARL